MESKKLLILAGVGATLGVVGYLYFKKNKPTISEEQLELLSPETKPQTVGGSTKPQTLSAIDEELFSPETKPQTVSGSTLGATFINAQTIVQNENVTVQESSLVVSQLLDMVQQKKAEELFAELQSNFNFNNVSHTMFTFKMKDYALRMQNSRRNCAIVTEINNLGYELVGLTQKPYPLYPKCNYSTLGTLRKIAV